ncbi:MAG: TIGR04066 family peptide maturation system protein [Clostridia bacterium]|nr:TIGR04066 family peptide maturation system protein [Clostridia bacterium]
MSEKERIAVYPYDAQFAPVLRHREHWGKYDFVGAASPPGWGISGKDAGLVDGGDDIDITIAGKIEDLFDRCDTVLFTSSEYELDFGILYAKIKKSIEAGKNILCSIELNKEVENEISKACERMGVYFKHTGLHEEIHYFKTESYKEKLFEIEVPVIFVGGTSDRTHKFEIQLSLRNKLQNAGYCVSQIGTRNYCELLGFHSFPGFMYSDMSETKKIIYFNNLVKRIELDEKPDVIILGIPGGIMPFSSQFPNHFGILAYEISQAVTPDAAVISTLYEDFTDEYFELLQKSVKYRFGFPISCFNYTNIQFDWTASREQEIKLFSTLDASFIDQKKLKYQNMNVPLFNVLNPGDADKMAEFILDQLAGFAEVESF